MDANVSESTSKELDQLAQGPVTSVENLTAVASRIYQCPLVPGANFVASTERTEDFRGIVCADNSILQDVIRNPFLLYRRAYVGSIPAAVTSESLGGALSSSQYTVRPTTIRYKLLYRRCIFTAGFDGCQNGNWITESQWTINTIYGGHNQATHLSGPPPAGQYEFEGIQYGKTVGVGSSNNIANHAWNSESNSGLAFPVFKAPAVSGKIFLNEIHRVFAPPFGPQTVPFVGAAQNVEVRYFSEYRIDAGLDYLKNINLIKLSDVVVQNSPGLFQQPRVTVEFIMRLADSSHSPDGGYGTPLMQEYINNFSQDYADCLAQRFQNGTHRLVAGGTNLLLGGLFDFRRNWLFPHRSHRAGENIDVSIPLNTPQVNLRCVANSLGNSGFSSPVPNESLVIGPLGMVSPPDNAEGLGDPHIHLWTNETNFYPPPVLND